MFQDHSRADGACGNIMHGSVRWREVRLRDMVVHYGGALCDRAIRISPAGTDVVQRDGTILTDIEPVGRV